MKTLVIARETCSCYFINSISEDIVKSPLFENLKVRHFFVEKDEYKSAFVVHLSFNKENSINIDIPVHSETFSYSVWEFGFQWKDENDRKSVSFSLNTESPEWEDFNNKYHNKASSQ